MERFSKWFKQLEKWFSLQENRPIKKIEATKKHYGRVQTSRHTEPKMIHHYPKKGKFRFPVIQDEAAQTSKMLKPSKQEPVKEPLQTVEKKVQKKLPVSPFKLSDIPSPVYGFRERSVKTEKMGSIMDKEAETTSMDAAYSIKYSENNTMIETEQQPVVIEGEENIDSSLVYVNPTQEQEQLNEVLVEREERKWTGPEEREEEKINQLLARAKQEESEILHPSEQSEHVIRKSQGANKSETKNNNSVVVPFNVMMLPTDKRNDRKKQTDGFQLPGIHLLEIPPQKKEENMELLQEQSQLLEATLENFHVIAKVVHVTKGPSVTRFEIQPAPGVKVSKITSLTDDIKLCLAAKDIRIEAPIPGKNTIGIEVPNLVSSPVFLREILRKDVFLKSESPLTVALGLDISGQPIVTDLKKMPHGLVAGATGSGKSVCINSILISLLYKATPDEVKLLLIDPKMVELAPYNEVPHLITPVITDAKLATAALKWVVGEMERRYELFSEQGTRDIGRYNDLFSENGIQALPYIVVVIDELADLMMVSPQDVEESICRIAQKARACGIHLLLATQRPSVDVITGLIKANIPTRIAFSVSSQTDSRTIIDMNGAERLLGKGDMLFHENGTAKPIRVQGTFVSDDEIERVISFVRKQRDPQYLIQNEQLIKIKEPIEEEDELFEEACFFVMEQGGASSSSLQRKYRIGFNRAARLIDLMEEKGIVSEAMGSKPRNVLVNSNELEDLFYDKG